MKKILFFTSNFPPSRSVGTQRVTKIIKYLNPQKYRFEVLTLKESYYPVNNSENPMLKRLPGDIPVSRTDMWDLTNGFTRLKSFFKKRMATPAQKSENGAEKNANPRVSTAQRGIISRIVQSVRTVLFSILEFPDKYNGWMPNAVKKGVALVKENDIDIILTTAPPHSLFVMARKIKRKTGAKLVLDFRDPWALSRWDKGSAIKTFFEGYLEKKTLKDADAAVFVTEKLHAAYSKSYPQYAHKFHVFYNGYDADDFQKSIAPAEKTTTKRFVHLGTLYKKRNPESLFYAVKNLKDAGKISAADIQIEFIGIVAQELNFLYQKLKDLGIDDIVVFKEPISFKESIKTMFEADVLIIVQPGTDLQIPAKLFEYMYTERPILALAEPDSATDNVIQKGQLGFVAASTEIAEIEEALLQMITHLNEPQLKTNLPYIESFNMKNYITQLEECFDKI